MPDDKKKKKQRKTEVIDDVALAANAETLGRFSEAGKQFKVAYDGVDNEAGKQLHQGLKQISESKVHPDFQEQNINQQAGYSAEVLDTVKQNAESIKKGDPTRVSRTDDLGRVNDMQADQVTLDPLGNVVDGSEVQVKFLGTDAKGNLEFVKKVSGREYSEHYPDGRFRVPSDQYDVIKTELKGKIAALEKQSPLTPEKQRQLEYLKKVDKNLKKATVSKSEAIEARTNPEKVTVREIGKTSHEAGLEAAKVGVLVGGGISLLTNTAAVLKGEKKVEEAVKYTAIDTAKAGGTSYAMGFANTALASVMKNSSNALVRSLGKANAPAYIITTAITTTKSLARLCRDEITVNEFFLEVGRSGTLLLASVQGAVVGQFLIPVPVVGALVGGLVSTLLCGEIYDCALGMKMLNAEIDEFTNRLADEIVLLREYQARLMQQIDLGKFKQDTEKYNNVSGLFEHQYSEQDFNLMLKLTYQYIGIPCPWGEGSLDNFMKDKKGVLTFG
jgi:hypothetical protein